MHICAANAGSIFGFEKHIGHSNIATDRDIDVISEVNSKGRMKNSGDSDHMVLQSTMMSTRNMPVLCGMSNIELFTGSYELEFFWLTLVLRPFYRCLSVFPNERNTKFRDPSSEPWLPR